MSDKNTDIERYKKLIVKESDMMYNLLNSSKNF